MNCYIDRHRRDSEMNDFQLAPFNIGGETIEFVVRGDEPHSRVFAAIAARNAMNDPDVAADILRDHAATGNYLSVFKSMLEELQQSYLFGMQPVEWFLGEARKYNEAYPNEELLKMVEFVRTNPPSVSDMQTSGMGSGLGMSGARTRVVDKDKEKRRKKAAHKAKMKNKGR
jgi:hypothetical protein